MTLNILPNGQSPPSELASQPDETAPEVIERLESLDDVIFPAIDGDAQALAQVEPAWREAVAKLGPEMVSESRNQYLRYARSTWEYVRHNAPGHRQRLLALLQIIAMLLGADA